MDTTDCSPDLNAIEKPLGHDVWFNPTTPGCWSLHMHVKYSRLKYKREFCYLPRYYHNTYHNLCLSDAYPIAKITLLHVTLGEKTLPKWHLQTAWGFHIVVLYVWVKEAPPACEWVNTDPSSMDSLFIGVWVNADGASTWKNATLH